MRMKALLKNDWTQPEPWKLSAAVQEKQPEPSAKAAKPEPAKTEAAPAAKQAEASIYFYLIIYLFYINKYRRFFV